RALAICGVGGCVLVIGCGGDDASGGTDPGTSPKSYDNVTACQNWVSATKCGMTDISMLVKCDTYKNVTTCDISGYFDCLTMNTKCNNGVLDASGWASCAQKAQCQ